MREFLYKYALLTIAFMVIGVLIMSCNEDSFPKPKAFLDLDYPTPDYHRFVNNCPYSFVLSRQSKILFENDCDAVVSYPKLKAKIHLTYRPVRDNLKEILQEADKLTTKHMVKASVIIPKVYKNPSTKVYGVLNNVQGESASNVQFYATDSIRYVLTAALYFEVRPNYDSLYPAIEYLKNDMMHMMETIEWKN